ncbi:MAG: IS630 family transposase [Candidatus Eremiobacteraeota bacterium]|nr:IS630 family transposase [Candidatus Eremiobacteraeota bacterium]
MALRAKIVLLANLGHNNSDIADQLGVDVKTARKWRHRYKYGGFQGLEDAERSGRPMKFDSVVRHEVFTAVVGPPPEPYSRWNLDLLAKHLVDAKIVSSISIETLSHWFRRADLKPHKVRGWLNSPDPEFKIKRDRIVEVYRNPPKDTWILSIDEKTNIQALERVRADQPMKKGQFRRVEWEYIRHGTANLLASFNVLTGQVIGELVEKNDSGAFIAFLQRLLRLHPRKKIILILDNGTTHKSAATTEFLSKNPRLIPHFTPTHASWLNQIELWFSALSRHALCRASFSGRAALVERIENYIAHHNQELALPYDWTTKGKPLTRATAKGRLRNRSIAREFRRACRSSASSAHTRP